MSLLIYYMVCNFEQGKSRVNTCAPKLNVIIRATVPALQMHGGAITAHFYTTLSRVHPELLNVFNKANQRRGGRAANHMRSAVSVSVDEHLSFANASRVAFDETAPGHPTDPKIER